MANQKAMNEEKFEGIMWRNAKSVFKAQKDVQRKPFGYFTVYFEMNANTGETEMQVRSWGFEELNSEKKAFKSFKGAVDATVAYFEQIDRLVRNLPQTAQCEAETAYRRVLARALKRGEEKQKQG